MTPSHCIECLEPAAEFLHDLGGSAICAECVAQCFIPCAGCSGLVPRDKACSRAEELYCATCHARPPEAEAAEPVGDEEAEALVTEYVGILVAASRPFARALRGNPVPGARRRDFNIT